MEERWRGAQKYEREMNKSQRRIMKRSDDESFAQEQI